MGTSHLFTSKRERVEPPSGTRSIRSQNLLLMLANKKILGCIYSVGFGWAETQTGRMISLIEPKRDAGM